MKIKIKILSTLVLSFALVCSFAQSNMTITTSGTPQSYVNSMMSGCIEVSNVTFTGAPTAIGAFANGESLGIPNGVIMSTGNVTSAPGPNNNPAVATNNNQPGDPTFNNCFNTVSSDAAILEFDFIPHSYNVLFTYVFASEAYPELPGTGVYDGMGIFVTGPGVFSGPSFLDSNIAVVPLTADYINVNNVNSGVNDTYFVNNASGLYCQYDGYTTPMLVTMYVTPCQTYHMKIVVADAHPMFDSAVLMGAQSLQSDFLLHVSNITSSGELDDISESCTNTLVISRINPLDSLIFPFNLSITGTATPGFDFTGISSGPHVIPYLQSNLFIDYSAILDTLTEGVETITFTFTHPSMCDSNCIASYSLTIDVLDNYPLVAGIVQNDTGICSVNTTYFNIETYLPPNMDPLSISYLWTNGETTSSIDAAPSSGMMSQYCVTISDICEQVVVDCINITNSNFSSIQVATTDNLCFGDELGVVQVSATGGMAPFNFNWNPAGIGSNTSNTINTLPAGIYNVTVTDTVGCSFSSAFVIDEPDSIFYTLSVFEPKCYGGADGSVSFQMFQGVPTYTYLWSNGETSAGLDSIPAGIYTITAHDVNGCTLVVPVPVSQPTQLQLYASNDIFICLGQTVPLSAYATGGTPSYFYFWSDGSTGPNSSVTPATSTIYTVQVSDLNGCLSNIETVNVNIYPPISVQLFTTDDSLCVGDQTSIHANIMGGTGGPYMAVFSDGASSDILPPPYMVAPEVTTVYEVTIEDFCGSPVGFNAITISVFEPPDVNISANIYEGCKPLTVSFEDMNYLDGNSYHWAYGDGTNELLSYTAFPTHVFVNSGLYDITLKVTSDVGCENTITSEELINVFPIPIARFHSTPEITSIIKPIVFFENVSDGAFISTWDFGDGSPVSNSLSPEHIYAATGQYLVTLDIENEFGCTDEFYQTVYVRNEYTFYVPTAISPTSAFSTNRYFRPYGEGIDPLNFHMVIYNRWGNKIYETFDLNHPWEGTINGKPGKMGETYPWVIIYKDFNGEEHQESGTVTIVE